MGLWTMAYSNTNAKPIVSAPAKIQWNFINEFKVPRTEQRPSDLRLIKSFLNQGNYYVCAALKVKKLDFDDKMNIVIIVSPI